MNYDCGACEAAVLAAEENPDLVIVEACQCHLHKACFLEALAEQIGEEDWICPSNKCRKRPMKAYQIIPVGGTVRITRHLPQKRQRAPDAENPIAMGVTSQTLGLTPLHRDFLDLPWEVLLENVHLSATFQHPRADEASFVECVLGTRTTPGASEVLKYIMVFMNYAVLQPCADIVQPSMKSDEDVLQAALVNRSLLHEMIYALACKGAHAMPGPEDRPGMTAEKKSRSMAVFFITELLLKLERAHRPGGKKQPNIAYSNLL
jgi:hypothetical protein